MKTRVVHFVMVAVVVMSAVACDRSEVSKAPSSPAFDVEQAMPEAMSASSEDELPTGAVVIERGSGPEIAVPAGLSQGELNAETLARLQATTYTSWTQISASDVNGMICHGDSTCLRNRFAAKIGSGTTIPKLFCVNSTSWTYSGSGATNPCPGQNWVAERRLKILDPVYGTMGALNTRAVPNVPATQFENKAYSGTMTINQEVRWANAQTTANQWSVTVTAGLTITNSVQVNFPFGNAGTSVAVNLSTAASTGQTYSSTWTSNYSNPPVTLQPRTGVKYTLKEKWQPQPLTYQVPMQLSGWVGADYFNGWNGHHAWAIDANSMFPEYNAGTEKFTVKETAWQNHVVWVDYVIYTLP
jgi:hypothetical protein